MADRWIITDHPFMEHPRLDLALREHARLAKKHPDKTFRVIHIKTTLPRSQSGRIMGKQRSIIAAAQPHVCSLLCPSTWRTEDGPPPHHELCQRMTAAMSHKREGNER